MQGGVRKRGTTWSYYFDLGKIDGKRKKKENGGFRTKKEAEQALTAAMNEYNNAGTVFEPSEITVSDYLDQWYDLYCKPNLRYNSQLGYLKIIEVHLIRKTRCFIKIYQRLLVYLSECTSDQITTILALVEAYLRTYKTHETE